MKIVNVGSCCAYSGSIDWNAVYRKYYNLNSVESRLGKYLDSHCQISFSGFGEIANRLANRHYVHFIEFSKSMVESARKEFPGIHKISNANIIDAFRYDETQVLFVVCRISAYWRSYVEIQRFLNGLKLVSKDLVVVDFFDDGKLEGSAALGSLKFSEIYRIQREESSYAGAVDSVNILLAKVQGSYTIDDQTHWYIEDRAFYNPINIRNYFAVHLEGYDVAIESPIVDEDPGFTLVLRRISV